VSEEQVIPTGRFKPLVSLLSHKFLALFIIISLITVGVSLSKKVKPSYSTKASVLVSPSFVPNLNSEKSLDFTQYQLYVRQQTEMLTRDDVLRSAIQSPELKKYWLHSGETEANATERLKEALSTENEEGSPFISITISSNKADGLNIVLNTIVKAYLKQSQAENIYDSSGRIEVLQLRQAELKASINKLQGRRGDIAEKLGVTTFQQNSLNPYDQVLIESLKTYNSAHSKTLQLETYFMTLTGKVRQGKNLLSLLANEKLNEDKSLKTVKEQLIKQRTNLLTKVIGLTPRHPTRLKAEREIANIDQIIKQAETKKINEIRLNLLEKSRAKILEAQQLEDSLAQQLKAQRGAASNYSVLYNEALVLNKKVARKYEQLNTISDRIDFLTIESTAPGFVRIDTLASSSLLPVNNSKKVLLIFIIAAIALGILVPIGIDLLDKRIRTPGEVQKILGFSPLAWILERNNIYAEQVATDSLRRMALALNRDWRSHDTTGFVLTSVKPGGGTTSVTLELARLLTGLGIRTLAVELNAFQPDDRYSNSIGFSEGLTSLFTPDDVETISPELLIIPGNNELPDRLPVGETSTRHLMTHGKLPQILNKLNEHYDVILLDAPPILLSSDAELLGEIASGVLLVIEANNTTPGELKRAAKLLERLNPPVVGAVLNRVKVFRGGGYFAEILKEYKNVSKK
jgi:succinoglycan biosynthesis transport protein ExoP